MVIETTIVAVTPSAVRFEPGRGDRPVTHVQLDEFDGPLGLLLALIESRQLDILSVSLGSLAGAYLEALASLGSDRIGNISGFVAVAGQLIVIKSRAMLPREPQAIAGITAGGSVAYNHAYSQGEIDEMVGENYSLIEQEKLTEMHNLNRLAGKGGTINKGLLAGHNVIVVSDGLKTGFPVDLVVEFLKPISIGKLIVAVPFAGIQAVDRMHVLADDLYCLNVIADYIDTDHYYDKQDVPEHAMVLKTIEQIVTDWK